MDNFKSMILLLISVMCFFSVTPQAYSASKVKPAAEVQTAASKLSSPVDFDKTANMKAIDALNLVLNKEKALDAVILKHKNDINNDKLFEVFYKDVENSVFVIHEKLLSEFRDKSDENDSVYNIGGIEFTVKKDDIYEITNPKTDLYIYQITEGFDSFKMNEKYLSDKYSKYLGKAWKRYLYLSAKNTEPCAADVDGYNIDKKTAEEWISSWNEFLSRYPDFPKNNDIRDVVDFVKEQFSENEREFEE